MAARKRPPLRATRRLAIAPEVIEPLVKPLVKPIVKPIVNTVTSRLDKHEHLLLEMRQALDVQFRRIAEIQAQLDELLAAYRKSRG